MKETKKTVAKLKEKTPKKSSRKSEEPLKANLQADEIKESPISKQGVGSFMGSGDDIIPESCELENADDDNNEAYKVNAGKDGKKEAREETGKKHPVKQKLCRIVKKDYLKKHFNEYEALVLNPAYICGKCGRASNDKKNLCKPIGISKLKSQ